MNVRMWSLCIAAAALAAVPLYAATPQSAAPRATISPGATPAGDESVGAADPAPAAVDGDDLFAAWDDAADDAPGAGGGAAPNPMMSHGRGAGGRAAYGARRARFAALDLSDDQRDKLRDIATELRRKTIPARADLQLAELDLREMLRDDKPDMRKVETQIDKISDMRGGMQKLSVGARVQMRSVLTTEQRRKLEQMPPGMGMGMHGRGMR